MTDIINNRICFLGGPAMAKLHDKEYKENDVDVEVQIEVKGHLSTNEIYS